MNDQHLLAAAFPVAVVVLSWLLTYLVHSSMLMGAVWLATRKMTIRASALRESLWKAAMVGAVLTATVQVFAGLQPFTGSIGLDRTPDAREATPASSPPAAPATSRTTSDLLLVDGSPGPGPVYTLLSPADRRSGLLATGPLYSVIVGEPATPRRTRPDVGSRSSARLIPVVRLHETEPLDGGVGRRPGSVPVTAVVAPLGGEAVAGPGGDVVRRAGAALAWIVTFWPVALVGLWALLAVALVARFARAHARVVRRLRGGSTVVDGELAGVVERFCRRLGFPFRVRLTAASGLRSPVAFGRRDICVPSRALIELDPAQQASMVAHELAHLVRRDPDWLVLCGVLERIFFFQPLNRVARQRIQQSAEYVCDDEAARLTGGLSLARCLAQVASWATPPVAEAYIAGMLSSRSPLVLRVQQVLDGAGRSLWRLPRGAAVALATVVVFAGTWLAPGFRTVDGALADPPAGQLRDGADGFSRASFTSPPGGGGDAPARETDARSGDADRSDGRADARHARGAVPDGKVARDDDGIIVYEEGYEPPTRDRRSGDESARSRSAMEDSTPGERSTRPSGIEVDAEVSVTRDGDGWRVTINDEVVPSSRVRIEGDQVLILDQQGQVAYRTALPAEAQDDGPIVVVGRGGVELSEEEAARTRHSVQEYLGHLRERYDQAYQEQLTSAEKAYERFEQGYEDAVEAYEEALRDAPAVDPDEERRVEELLRQSLDTYRKATRQQYRRQLNDARRAHGDAWRQVEKAVEAGGAGAWSAVRSLPDIRLVLPDWDLHRDELEKLRLQLGELELRLDDLDPGDTEAEDLVDELKRNLDELRDNLDGLKLELGELDLSELDVELPDLELPDIGSSTVDIPHIDLSDIHWYGPDALDLDDYFPEGARDRDLIELLEDGTDVNRRLRGDVTLLHLAASRGDLDAAEELVDRGALVGAIDDEGRTPLHLAAFDGDVDVIRTLIDHGAAVDALDRRERAPLDYAARSDEWQAVAMLVEAGADPNRRAPRGATALHLAALSGELEAMRVLIDHGADLNVPDDRGRTPLHLAVAAGDSEIVQELLDAGADPELADERGRTAIDVAERADDPVMVEILSESRARR